MTQDDVGTASSRLPKALRRSWEFLRSREGAWPQGPVICKMAVYAGQLHDVVTPKIPPQKCRGTELKTKFLPTIIIIMEWKWTLKKKKKAVVEEKNRNAPG